MTPPQLCASLRQQRRKSLLGKAEIGVNSSSFVAPATLLDLFQRCHRRRGNIIHEARGENGLGSRVWLGWGASEEEPSEGRKEGGKEPAKKV